MMSDWDTAEQAVKNGKLPVCEDCKKEMEIKFDGSGRPIESNYGWMIHFNYEGVEHTKCPECSSKFIKKHLKYKDGSFGVIDDVMDYKTTETTTLSDYSNWSNRFSKEDFEKAKKLLENKKPPLFDHIQIMIPIGKIDEVLKNETIKKILKKSSGYFTNQIVETKFLTDEVIIRLKESKSKNVIYNNVIKLGV
jgi:carboxypeptidase C (cathepsin A)